MKNFAAIIMFSICLLVILETNNAIKCYQCNATVKGCNAAPLPSQNLLQPCPANYSKCYSHYPPSDKNVIPVDVRGCLAEDAVNNCSINERCYWCQDDKCNT